jgi:small subunit ribosomal protein S1
MDTPNPWQDDNDEEYWNAVVNQGQWAEPAPDSPQGAFVGKNHVAPVSGRFNSIELDSKWETLNTLFTDGTVLCLSVTGYNKGGLLVDWEALQGFVPTSQLSDAPIHAEEWERMDHLAGHVGQSLELKVIELDRSQNRIIFSQRAARWGECCPDDKLTQLRAGDILDGEVSNLCDFGVFVDLGGVDGLIHVSELSWQRVTHPRDLLTVGHRVKVYVIDVDNRRRRIALSLKRLQSNPWATVGQRYRPGMVVRGVVTNVVEFGAFVRIEQGVEGLIHISELSQDSGFVSHPHDVIREGTDVPVRILSVDADNQRMALSLRGVGDHHLMALPGLNGNVT